MTTIVTTCMGRLSFLKQALPTWLRTGLQVLVVDYDCPDGTGEWIEATYIPWRVQVLYVDADHANYTRPIFNKARALNAAFDKLAACGEDRVLLLDADTMFFGNWHELDVPRDEFRIVLPGVRDLTGVLMAPLQALLDIGGANEGMAGYGVEDLDLRLRLFTRAKLKVSRFSSRTFGALPHDDELRGQNYANTDIGSTARANLALMWRGLEPDEVQMIRDNLELATELLGGYPP
jgi:hypothetical protein